MKKFVQLNDIKFYSKHGFFEEEQKTGNNFILNISVCQEIETLTDTLSDTIDYSSLFLIAKEEMAITSKLLEDVIHRILARLEKVCSQLLEISISIKKQSPPFGGNCSSSEVKIVKNY